MKEKTFEELVNEVTEQMSRELDENIVIRNCAALQFAKKHCTVTNPSLDDLMTKAKRQLEHGMEYGRVTFADILENGDRVDKLKEKMEEIAEEYLDEVPESFENVEELECYIQELRHVIEECKADVETVREWSRRYHMTKPAKAVLADADDTIQDLIFERSACERAYDIVHELIKNEEKAELERERELEAAQVKDEDELLIAMYRLARNYGYDRLRFLVGIVSDYIEETEV